MYTNPIILGKALIRYGDFKIPKKELNSRQHRCQERKTPTVNKNGKERKNPSKGGRLWSEKENQRKIPGRRKPKRESRKLRSPQAGPAP